MAGADLVLTPLSVDAEGVRNVHIEGVEQEGAVLAVLQLRRGRGGGSRVGR